ncbi:MAG TPA: serpin family protein [Gemmatimonadaceae bacterium]
MPNYRRRWLSLAVIALTGAASCGGSGASDNPTEPKRGAARTSLPRELTTSERDVLSASNAFSFGLWKTINQAQRDSNVFVSPLSASFALGMTMNGAAGQTYDEMRTALRFGNASLASIDSGYKSLIGLLTSLDASTTMQIANSIFYRQGVPFVQTFLDDASKWFDAEVKAQNFGDVAGTLSAVNGWASAKTNGRIPTVLQQVDPNDVMYLLNAIYFKGSWRDKFDPALTRDAPFHPATGADQTAKLMQRQGKMAYAETDTYQAVDLAYGDSAFTMTVLLPKAGTSVETVAASLTPESWQSLTSKFRAQEVALYLPKITFSWKRKLIEDMKAQGMVAAFKPGGADFTRMSSAGKDLFISLLQQNTFVAIDEEGTEAAAVTIVGVTLTSAPLVVNMRVDRPYVFVIRERLSGTVLFMGKIARMP